MHVFVGHVEKEGSVLVGLDEADRGLGEVGGEVLLIETDVGCELLFAAPVGDRELVVGVRDTLVEIEAVAGWEEFSIVREIAQMPLAHHAGCVAGDSQRFGQGDLGVRQTAHVRIMEVGYPQARGESRQGEGNAVLE